eukprot:GDKJ01053439.1.p1 GENE.GDKJ01053439.1~~GDKJ01053439.1.p1  ORF type:complete len:577 (+),score=129.94 GDKJ01053439.1:190-1731(+)
MNQASPDTTSGARPKRLSSLHETDANGNPVMNNSSSSKQTQNRQNDNPSQRFLEKNVGGVVLKQNLMASNQMLQNNLAGRPSNLQLPPALPATKSSPGDAISSPRQNFGGARNVNMRMNEMQFPPAVMPSPAAHRSPSKSPPFLNNSASIEDERRHSIYVNTQSPPQYGRGAEVSALEFIHQSPAALDPASPNGETSFLMSHHAHAVINDDGRGGGGGGFKYLRSSRDTHLNYDHDDDEDDRQEDFKNFHDYNYNQPNYQKNSKNAFVNTMNTQHVFPSSFNQQPQIQNMNIIIPPSNPSKQNNNLNNMMLLNNKNQVPYPQRLPNSSSTPIQDDHNDQEDGYMNVLQAIAPSLSGSVQELSLPPSVGSTFSLPPIDQPSNSKGRRANNQFNPPSAAHESGYRRIPGEGPGADFQFDTPVARRNAPQTNKKTMQQPSPLISGGKKVPGLSPMVSNRAVVGGARGGWRLGGDKNGPQLDVPFGGDVLLEGGFVFTDPPSVPALEQYLIGGGKRK